VAYHVLAIFEFAMTLLDGSVRGSPLRLTSQSFNHSLEFRAQSAMAWAICQSGIVFGVDHNLCAPQTYYGGPPEEVHGEQRGGGWSSWSAESTYHNIVHINSDDH